jgi:uncharacterized protein YidB (DUF937 family)
VRAAEEDEVGLALPFARNSVFRPPVACGTGDDVITIRRNNEEAHMGILDSILGSNQQSGRGGLSSPLTLALLGVLAYRTMHGKGRLADMLGGGASDGTRASSAPAQAAGGLGGLLGGLLGGSNAGSAVSAGLQDLLARFEQNGQGDKVKSWIGTGTNQPISSGELEQALGEDRIEWLTKQTGLSRDELLAGLSQHLPEAVDKLTPQGRIPNHEEAERLI